MPARIGRIPYLNAAPFYLLFAELGWKMVDLPPRQLAGAARRGELDAAPFSLLDALKLGEEFQPVGGLIIGVRSIAGSVILFSRVPPEELKGSSRVALPAESTTSVALVRVILKERYKVSPRACGPGQADAEARLLIGDAALRAHENGLPGYPHELDLGQAWWEWQGLPFVFALWKARVSLPPQEREKILKLAEGSLTRWFELANRTDWYRPWAERLGISEAALSDYLGGFVYRQGEQEVKGIGEFLECVRRLGPDDEFLRRP